MMRLLLLPLLLLLLLVPLAGCSDDYGAWMAQPPDEWPQVALVNEVWYLNGQQYVDPSFSYAGTGFLIDTGDAILAATAKHLLWVARTSDMRSVDVDDRLARWILHPKGQPEDSVVVDRLLNADPDETLLGPGSSVLERDWLVFSTAYVSPRLQPLRPRYTDVAEGETVHFFACPYQQPACVTGTGTVRRVRGNRLIVSNDGLLPLSGASGAPIVDADGYLVGILSGASIDPETGAPAIFGITTHYLRKVLDGEQPLNTPLVSVRTLLWPTIQQQGVGSAVQQYRALAADARNHFVFDFVAEELNRLGQDLIAAGDVAGAIEIYRLSLEEMPWFPATYMLLARAYVQQNQPDQAIATYEAALTRWPEDARMRQALQALQGSDDG